MPHRRLGVAGNLSWGTLLRGPIGRNLRSTAESGEGPGPPNRGSGEAL